ncbi:LysR family transcriptional regulator [Burkholderia gladioli]|uniref:LysR family transcriptional regulator n=1 Tax=Burkholderia gladioli TaxID=28095 RepID=UPI003D1F6B63
MKQENSTMALSLSSRTLSLEALRSFVAIQETGSFRHAAVRVNLSPSAVSLQISKLEELLGYRLLERNARRVLLTEHGSLLLRHARTLLALNDETLALFCQSSLEGRLVLAASHDLGTAFVPELLLQMAERHPRIRIDVLLGAGTSVMNGFTRGRSNVVFFNDVGPPAIPSQKIWSEPLVWLMARGGRALSLDPLPLAVASNGCAWREVALNALDASDLPYRIAYSSDAPAGQAAAVRADLAIAALPASMADRDLLPVPSEAELPELPQTHVRVAHDNGELSKALATMAQEVALRTTSKLSVNG